MAKRILRLTASPHAIAAGVAAGVFASFTPFLGFHFVIAFFISYFIAGNFFAAALGTFFGNPFTFPVIWASTYTTGKFILSGGRVPTTASSGPDRLGEIAGTDVISVGFGELWANLARIWDPVVKPMMIGAIPLGILVGIAAYVLTRWIAIGFRRARRKQLALRAVSAQRRSRRRAERAKSIEAAAIHERKSDADPQTGSEAANAPEPATQAVASSADQPADEPRQSPSESAAKPEQSGQTEMAGAELDPEAQPSEEPAAKNRA